jgi:DNA primase catalytic subunit
LTRDSVRYDAGPVLNVPPREFLANRRMQIFDKTNKIKLNEKWVAYSEFRIDIDATELKEVRAFCKCGSAKEKLCKECVIAVGALAKYYEIKLKANFNIPITSWHSSGARGLHGFSQCLAPSQPFYERRQQIVNDMLDTATTPPEALSILQAAEGSLQGTKIRVTVDSGVTVSPSHYTRGLFSIHDTTQRICVPIDADPQTFHVDSSPLLSDVRANPDGHVEWQACLRRVRERNACKKG